MSKLREGAKGMAEQLMQQSRGQQDSQGRDGEARGDDRDPLGRPMPSTRRGHGPRADMLPSELAIERARQILDMLRSNAGEAGLPKYERDYIDRLLQRPLLSAGPALLEREIAGGEPPVAIAAADRPDTVEAARQRAADGHGHQRLVRVACQPQRRRRRRRR